MILRRLGGEAPHVERVVQKQGGDVRAVEQVLHVVVRPGQLVHLGLQLVVDRLQLFVQGLHLFLGGGQLLVGGLEFLVGGLQFLVGGFELFLGGLHLFAGGLQLLAGLLELLLQFRRPGACGGCLRSCPALSLSAGAATSVKTIMHHPPQRLRLREGLDGDVHGLRPAVGSSPSGPSE